MALTGVNKRVRKGYSRLQRWNRFSCNVPPRSPDTRSKPSPTRAQRKRLFGGTVVQLRLAQGRLWLPAGRSPASGTPRIQISAQASRDPGGIRFLRSARIHCIEPDARDPRRFLYEVARDLRAFTRHNRTGSQRKPQSVCLILEIQNHLSRHKLLPGPGSPRSRAVRPGNQLGQGSSTAVLRAKGHRKWSK